MPHSLAFRTREALVNVSPSNHAALDELRALYADDVEFEDPIQKLHGRDAFMAMNERLLRRARDLRFEIHSVAGDDSEFFLVWSMSFAPKLGPRMSVDGTTHIRAREGRIVFHRDYWDLVELLASAVPGGRAAMRIALSPFA